METFTGVCNNSLELEDYVTEDERSQFSLQLEDAENWLYEDGEEVDKPVYVAKLTDLKGKGEPIKRRKVEFEVRPSELESLGRSLMLAHKIVDQYKAGDEKYDHLDKDGVAKVEKLIMEKREWLDKNTAVLNSLKKCADPPIVAQAIRNERTGFETIANPILNKSKPKPKVEPPPMDDKKKEDQPAPTKEGQEQPQNPEEQTQQEVNGGGGGGADPNMDLD